MFQESNKGAAGVDHVSVKAFGARREAEGYGNYLALFGPSATRKGTLLTQHTGLPPRDTGALRNTAGSRPPVRKPR